MNIKNLLKTATLLSAAVTLGLISSCAPTAPTAGTANTAGADSFPIAKPVLDEAGQPRKDLFISPYAPYNPIDTRGYNSGDVVGDPSTAMISEKTGKPVLSTSKAFRIP